MSKTDDYSKNSYLIQKPGLRKEIRFHPDLMWLVDAEFHSHHIEFRCFQVEFMDNAGKLFIESEIHGESYTSNIENAYCEFHGSVKWDGCSNWMSNSSCYIHFCRREQLVQFGELMARCYDWADEEMKIS